MKNVVYIFVKNLALDPYPYSLKNAESGSVKMNMDPKPIFKEKSVQLTKVGSASGTNCSAFSTRNSFLSLDSTLTGTVLSRSRYVKNLSKAKIYSLFMSFSLMIMSLRLIDLFFLSVVVPYERYR